MNTRFQLACAHAVGGGITAAALIDRDANVVALAGTRADTDLRAIVGVLSESLKGDEEKTPEGERGPGRPGLN